jgi:DNA-binding NarL/FixJ family response regulator
MRSIPSKSQAATAPPTILIVDDNRHMRRLLQELLQAAWLGSSILQAADANGAISLCRQAAPNVVVMDIGLPDLDGIEATSIIRLLNPEIAVVILSSHDGRAYRDAARSAGAAAYVAKTEVSTALIPAITAALNGRALAAMPGVAA